MSKKTSFFERINIRAWIIIFLLGIISALIRYSALPQVPIEWHIYTFFVFLAALFGVWALFKYINYLLNQYLPYKRGVLKRIFIQLGLGILIMSALRELWMISLENNIPDDIPVDLVEMFYARPFRHILFILDILISLTVNGNFIAYHFFGEWKKSLIKLERTEKERAQVHFDNLKNQLNPHFLFNSLTSLNSLIFENQQLASAFLQQLSKVYRYVLQNREHETVTVKTELEFIKHYTSLLATRFKSMLHIEINVSENGEDCRIVPVTLQVLIENAVKHNIVSEQHPLTISIYDEPDYLVVANNLQPKNSAETSNKLGLENMRKLYSYLSENDMLIEQDQHTFKIKIPLL